MKAIVYHKSGSGDVLTLQEIAKPTPADDEVLLKVHAASVNPLDYHLLHHPFLRRILSKAAKVKNTNPGRDVAGRVESVGENVTRFKAGDEVFGTCSGAFAEFACARESALTTKPATVSFEQAASAPIAGLTALQALRDRAKVQPGQKVLVNGAAGGVGTFAVQIAKVLGANVTGVCSTRNVEMVRSIGADIVIDYTRDDFTRNGQRYDFIFDVVSNHSFSDHRRALTPNGTYIGAGMIALNGSMIRLLLQSLPQLVMAPFVSQKFMSFMAKMNADDLKTIGAFIEDGKVTPVIDRRYSLSEVADAVRYVEQGHARGKVIIVTSERSS